MSSSSFRRSHIKCESKASVVTESKNSFPMVSCIKCKESTSGSKDCKTSRNSNCGNRKNVSYDPCVKQRCQPLGKTAQVGKTCPPRPGTYVIKSECDPPKKNWRQTHEEFIKTVRAVRECCKKCGKPKKLSPKMDREVKCPHCYKTINLFLTCDTESDDDDEEEEYEEPTINQITCCGQSTHDGHY